MKKSDIDRIVQTYSGEQEAVISGPFTRAMGINPAAILNLYKQVRNDLDERNYGISWWRDYEPSLDWKRRILISDQLLKYISSIEDNLIEAHLHFLEAQDHWEKYSRFMADSIRYDRTQGLAHNYPPPDALSDLDLNLRDTHIAGFFRAIGSVVDCIAGAVIGVTGLPMNLKKADIDRVRNRLRKGLNLNSAQQDFGEKFEAQIKMAGPDGWLSWATQYRNMLVHRARRLQINSQKVVPLPGRWGEPLVDISSNPIIRTETIAHLAKNPELSDIEAFIQNNGNPLLQESAETTMKGMLCSLETLVSSCLIELLEFWNKRKSDPSLVVQPPSQWPDGPCKPIEEFTGYSPGSTPVDFKHLASRLELIQRMRAASLAGEEIKRWDE